MVIQMNGILHPIFKKTQPVMMRKRKMTSGRSQENSFIVTTLYQESNCTCRKKKHFLFRWSTSTLPEQHVHHSMYCWKNRLQSTGTWMEKETYLMHGQGSQNSPYWTKGHLIGTHGSGGDLQENKLSLVRCMARYVDAYVWCSKEESKTKIGYRETKTRQCQTSERNILYWTKRWRIQAHNESRS